LIYITFLNGHLKKFKATVIESANAIVRASLLLHMATSNSFKKTAINFHYEFNLRHISNIFQGMLLTIPEKYTEPERFIRLFVHECERTYGDRLVQVEHLKIYRENMFDIVKK
jgi:dynein heavy chain